MHECSGGSCSISCVHLLSPGWGGAGGGGTAKSSYLCLEAPEPLRVRVGAARYFPFLRQVTLATATFICKTVGAGGEREILKSSLPSPPAPFHSSAWPACPLAFFPTPPCALFISASASLGHSPLGFCRPPPPPTFYSPCFGATAASERIQPPHLCSCVCIPRLLVTRGSRSTGFSGS